MVRLLRQARVRGWRRHGNVIGKPDFVWESLKVALFVDGCFWHRCPRCFRMPKSRVEYWSAKIANNQRRDRRVSRLLNREGWSVIRVWECVVSEPRTLARITRTLERRKQALLKAAEQGRELD